MVTRRLSTSHAFIFWGDLVVITEEYKCNSAINPQQDVFVSTLQENIDVSVFSPGEDVY